jgi:hypothetical protein
MELISVLPVALMMPAILAAEFPARNVTANSCATCVLLASVPLAPKPVIVKLVYTILPHEFLVAACIGSVARHLVLPDISLES